MTLAARVFEHLRGHGIGGAIIGGVVMAIHGIARATVDLDVPALNAALRAAGLREVALR